MPSTIVCDFEYERLLKFLLPFLNEEQIRVLKQWKPKERIYSASWESFELRKDKTTTEQMKDISDDILHFEDTLIDTISLVFLETPEPSSASGLWDAGKEKSTIKERENSIIEIKKIVTERYAQIRENVPVILQADNMFKENIITENEDNHAATPLTPERNTEFQDTVDQVTPPTTEKIPVTESDPPNDTDKTFSELPEEEDRSKSTNPIDHLFEDDLFDDDLF